MSYARKDIKSASAIRQQLLKNNINCWWDQDISAGNQWRSEIERRLHDSMAVVVLWSENSVKSPAVIEEASRAQAAGKLIQIRVDKISLPYGFAETQYIAAGRIAGKPSVAEEKLVSAVRGKASTLSTSQLRTRIIESSSTATKIVSGKIAVVDSPPNARPPVSHKSDLKERLRAQCSLSDQLEEDLSANNCNLPQAIRRSISKYSKALQWSKVCWYALDDAAASVAECVNIYQDEDWPGTTLHDVKRLALRHRQLEPLLRPQQPEEKKSTEQPELQLESISNSTLSSLATQASELAADQASIDTLDDTAIEAINHYASLIKDNVGIVSYYSNDTNAKNFEIRNSILKLGAIAGSIVAASAAGVAANILTAPEAAITLASKAEKLFSFIVSLF
ncbi:toll/interleukin-1 receptor domain-containing protein [Rhizobium sp. BE258]|uniref:toll/interleukin-1 receptor domain-containing protein n=1 Tax=Rhizobium sp. BE258 TaxID=2817722 RepID=UPI00286AE8CF|nr:toll/interleukin-1 receptor domain-containing protein [Rhizobium sp. BE258]